MPPSVDADTPRAWGSYVILFSKILPLLPVLWFACFSFSRNAQFLGDGRVWLVPAIAGTPVSWLPTNIPGFPVTPQGLTLVYPSSYYSAVSGLATLTNEEQMSPVGGLSRIPFLRLFLKKKKSVFVCLFFKELLRYLLTLYSCNSCSIY